METKKIIYYRNIPCIILALGEVKIDRNINFQNEFSKRYKVLYRNEVIVLARNLCNPRIYYRMNYEMHETWDLIEWKII